MKDPIDLGGCYPPRPKPEVDNTPPRSAEFLYAMKAEFNNFFSIHSKYFPILKRVLPIRSLFFCSPKTNNLIPRFSLSVVQ